MACRQLLQSINRLDQTLQHFSVKYRDVRCNVARHNRIGARAVKTKAAAVSGASASSDRSRTHRVTIPQVVDANQEVRQGDFEAALVELQASKEDIEQPSISDVLQSFDQSTVVDVAIVGCGPAGLCLAYQMAKRGLKVGLIGKDVPFVNNYGVWTDEFEQLGMSDTLDCSFPDAVCYFGEEHEVRVGRGYGRVCRRKLRKKLLQQCKDAGVGYIPGIVESFHVTADGRTVVAELDNSVTISARMVTLASGGAAGKFLRYEDDAPPVAAQTAYGIEAEVEGYDTAYPKDLMLFMDYRRHHSGVWDNTALNLTAGNHPNAAEGLWGTQQEAPSFLYAMPLPDGKVFLEETCLVARPALPFAVLKRRLERRMRAMGVKVTKLHEEEWSYIPVGGPMPVADQYLTAFGAAANLVHPATGFSIARSLREAPLMAEQVALALSKNQSVAESAAQVWKALWPAEKRRQASFNVFGMELLANLDLAAINAFFITFFRLPPKYWRGFLASSLTSLELIAFAAIVFAIAPMSIRLKLIGHLATDPSGKYLLNVFTAELRQQAPEEVARPAPAAAIAGLMLWLQSQQQKA